MEVKKISKELIHELFEKDNSINVIDSIKKDGIDYKGKIGVSYLTTYIEFEVEIPFNYPLTRPNSDNISIVFRNKELLGYSHVNNDGSVCFHPEKDHCLKRKFQSELNSLKEWIRDYYILKKEDENYNYILHNIENKTLNFLYFTNINQSLTEGSFGTFRYSVYTKKIHNNIELKKLFRLSLNSKEDKWSNSFTHSLKKNEIKKGIFYYSNKEPLDFSSELRKGAIYWDQLEYYFSDDFKRYFYELLKYKLKKEYELDSCVYFLIGYKIPNKESYEDHWDLIKVQKNKIPLQSYKVGSDKSQGNKKFVHTFKNDRILWNLTENIDYSRFFGRGKLDSSITESTILLIGCGALGSTLAETLVRGGARNIVIEDFDNIEGGNLCRANYNLDDLIFPKTTALKNRLQTLSPFLNINYLSKKLSNYNGDVLKNKVDIIFDCTADPEVAYILDQMDYKGHVFSFGISNKAKSLVSITGENFAKQSKVLFDLVESEPPNYFPGTGCGYPTFEASFNDINTLLHTALKVINSNFEGNISQNSFIIRSDFNLKRNIVIDEFDYYKNTLNNDFLMVSKQTIAKIKRILLVHYPKEFGGIFVGYRNKTNYVITDILIPDKYKSGKTIFVREPGDLNKRLELLYKESKGKFEYIGEWHSHPDGLTNPSTTDRKAMKEIIDNKDVKIENPILMIASLSEESFEIDFYYSTKNKLVKYGR